MGLFAELILQTKIRITYEIPLRKVHATQKACRSVVCVHVFIVCVIDNTGSKVSLKIQVYESSIVSDREIEEH